MIIKILIIFLILSTFSLVLANYWDNNPEKAPCIVNKYMASTLMMNTTTSQKILIKEKECELKEILK